MLFFLTYVIVECVENDDPFPYEVCVLFGHEDELYGENLFYCAGVRFGINIQIVKDLLDTTKEALTSNQVTVGSL
jgi:hypothetical protein